MLGFRATFDVIKCLCLVCFGFCVTCPYSIMEQEDLVVHARPRLTHTDVATQKRRACSRSDRSRFSQSHPRSQILACSDLNIWSVVSMVTMKPSICHVPLRSWYANTPSTLAASASCTISCSSCVSGESASALSTARISPWLPSPS